MRVAYVVSAFPLVSETFVLDQITGLIERGHSVSVHVLKHIKEDIVHNDVEKYHLLDNIHTLGNSYLFMPESKVLRLKKAMNLWSSSNKSTRKILFKSLNVFKYGAKAANLSLFYLVAKWIEDDIECDVVHCHFGTNGALLALLKDIGIVKAPLVTTFHGQDITEQVKLYGDDVYQRLFTHGDKHLPISSAWRERLIELGCPENRIKIHRMGIALPQSDKQITSSAHTQVAPESTSSDIKILTVARFVEKKGLRFAIAAIQKIVNRFPHIRYQIVGDGPLKAELEDQVRKADLQNNISFLGLQEKSGVAKLMESSDIFMLPSVTAQNGDKEGIPVVLMEAMSKMLPVISTYHSGIPELIENDVSGLLVNEKDEDALAECISLLIENPDMRRSLAAAAFQVVERDYNLHKLNDELVELFSSLVATN